MVVGGNNCVLVYFSRLNYWHHGGVARGKSRAFSAGNIGGVVFHGITAILVLFFLFKALGS